MAEGESEDAHIQARLQVPSAQWLKVHSLSAQSLNLDQILPGLGFKQKEGRVESLKSVVTSQYADGMFTQQPNSRGQIYNVCGGSGDRLEEVEGRLQEAVALLKARHTWLNSGSRLHFGVVYGRCVVMVMDSCATEHAQLKPFLDVACDVIREQFIHVEKFTVIRCTAGVECWNAELMKTTSETIANAVEWVQQTPPQTPPIRTNIVEALIKALSLGEADNIYLFTHGNASLRAFDLLLEKASPSLIPVHVVVYGCNDGQSLDKYQQLAQVSGAKCHCYAPPPTPPPSRHSSLMSLSSAGSKSPPLSIKRPGSGRSSINRPGSAASSIASSRPTSAAAKMMMSVSFQPPANFPLGNEDADLMWAELERARDTLADIQALRLEEIGGEGLGFMAASDGSGSEDYMTSTRWLEVHGLKANKLMFQDLVGSLAFRHCNGRVQMPHPSKSSTGSVEMISQSKIVHAQYCKEFVHIRWEGERVVHIELTNHIHRIYREKVEKMLIECRDRLGWLKRGSRELFGTLLEDRLVVVIDTSASMKDRLELVKTKIQQLIEEQLKEKEKCTIFHFNSSVHSWREHLVPTSEQNLRAISQWVEGLCAEGSTNTLDALSQAMSVREVQAVYLLTDGRPDQPESEVLAKVQQLPSIPVHTISFNCADSKANFFLSQLSNNTGGRYYYYSEDVSDPDGPKTYESDDIRELEREIRCGEEQLSLANQLLSECCAARKRGGKGRKTSKAKKLSNSSSSCAGTGGRRTRGFMATRRWLEKNSLSALKLTLMDALGPSAIPHSAKDVPILNKKVSAKVFNSIFPLAHVSNGNQVTLINPNGVDLKSYEERLRSQVNVYWDRLTKLAWDVIPSEKKGSVIAECGHEETDITDPLSLAYRENKDILRNTMEKLGWPRPQANFDLLEAEIQRAENFIKYSESLREEAGRRQSRHTSRERRTTDRLKSQSMTSTRTQDDGGSSVSLFSPTSGSSLIELLDQLELHTAASPSPRPRPSHSSPATKKPRPMRQNLYSQKVIARSSEDGFYYPGLVLNHTDSRHVIVKFADGHQISMLRKFVIPIGGAAPCPLLQTGDHVLVQVRTRRGPHPSQGGSCDYFIPGTIQVLPENNRVSHALHTVLVFNGRTVTCPRRGVVKITESLYKTVCKFINLKMSKFHSKMEQESEHGEYASDFSNEKNSNSRRSSTHTPFTTSPAHSSVETERSKSRLSDDGHSETSEHHSRVEVDNGETRRKNCPQSKHGAEIKSLLESQQTQGELLEQYKHDLEELQERQRLIEEQMMNKREDVDDKERSRRSHTEEIDTGSNQLVHQETGTKNGRRICAVQGMESRDSMVQCCEQGVNTGPWMEEKAVETDPMTESRGVGTEWPPSEGSSCSSESEGEGEGEGERGVKEGGEEEREKDREEASNELPLKQSTSSLSPLHASTPLPSSPSHSVASSQSKHSTPNHTISPSPSHKSTPTSSPSHKSTPSPTPVHIPSVTVPATVEDDSKHQTDSVLTDSTEEKKDLPSIAQRLVELGVDAFVGLEVLARWPDDGWYYRAKVVGSVGQHRYQVMDACEDLETIHLSDMITDTQDADTLLQVGSTVVALHPDYAYSYAPGHVTTIHTTIVPCLHYSVQLYDGSTTVLPRQEIYNLPSDKYQSCVDYLQLREKAWIGQRVIARNDSDGLYYPATVEALAKGPGQYSIKWERGGEQEQSAFHMFGALTKRRELRIGDYVIAQTQPKHLGVCMPGQIQAPNGHMLQIKFCDDKIDAVDPVKDCYWVTADYYQSAVEFISSMVELSTPSMTTVHSENELMSEYSASYGQ